jgi:hypothetical protein
MLDFLEISICYSESLERWNHALVLNRMSVASIFVMHLVNDLRLCTEEPLSNSVCGRQRGELAIFCAKFAGSQWQVIFARKINLYSYNY